MKKKDRIKQLLKDDTKRPLYLQRSLFYFGLYYFPQFFSHPGAPFHKQRAKDLDSDKNVMLIGFRESAKTIWAMIKLIKMIVYKERRFVLFYSFEQNLAASRLFDAIVQLKTNKKLIRDFGQLFPDSSSKADDGLQKKSVSEFITSNHIKFKAMSIGTSSRGLLYINKDGAFRPDAAFFDDVDVIESVRNPEIVLKNIDFMEGEVFGGLDSEAKIIFLGNIITSIGLVPHFEAKFKLDKNYVVHRQPVIENGKIARDRFVHTDAEVEEWKAKGVKKVSLEKKQRDQQDNYAPNFLLIPNIRMGNPVFDRDIVQELIEPEYTIDERYKELKIYKEPTYDVCFGIDSSLGGAKGDPSTITGRNSNYDLVVSFEARYDPESLAEVMEYIFDLGYIGNIVPEMNSMGTSLINSLTKTKCKDFIYREKTFDKVTKKTTKRYGIYMTDKLKRIVIDTMRRLIKQKEIKEVDSREKEQLFTYYYDDKQKMNALTGHHDDLIISDALCIHGLQEPIAMMFS